MSTPFPSSLQQKLNAQGFSHKVQDNIIRSEVEMGKPKQRQRYTTIVEEFQGNITVHLSEINTFVFFWRTDLKNGALPFTFPHPFTGEVTEMEFLAPYEITNLSGEYFNINMNFRVIP
ncbi:MAG: hypothetical protein EOM04_08805 [Clostridia bacterium]|nr:hypothetical protein [Clostridia bacterium]